MAYFDFASTSKPNNEVLKLYEKIATTYWANPSSMHILGVQAENLLGQARNMVLKTLKLINKKVVFTSSATEANNIAIQGICKNYLGQNKTIITSSIEHPSVSNCMKEMEKQGFRVIYLPVNELGVIDLHVLKQSLNNDVILVSLMWVNNIIGSIQPIDQVIELIKPFNRIKLHVDAVQGIGKLNPHFDLNKCDFITFSGHKINGIKGTGALIINEKCDISSPLIGSNQQYNMRPGTIDVAGSVSLAKALQLAVDTIDQHYSDVLNKCEYLSKKLQEIPNVFLNSNNVTCSPYITSVSVLNTNSETIVHFLEKEEIYVGSGSACNSKIKKPEKTVLALTNDIVRSSSVIRICLDSSTTFEEIDQLINALTIFCTKKVKLEVEKNA